jgi:chromosome segregation ATPase
MQASEAQRRELFDRVRDHLDEETAALLLEVTVPANVELATRSDLRELRAEMLLGFTQIDGRITEVESRLSGRLARLEERFDGLETRFSRLEERFSKLETRLSGLEERFDGLETRLGRLEDRFDGLEKRVDGVERAVHDLSQQLYTTVLPILIGATAAIVGFATWIGTVIG